MPYIQMKRRKERKIHEYGMVWPNGFTSTLSMIKLNLLTYNQISVHPYLELVLHNLKIENQQLIYHIPYLNLIFMIRIDHLIYLVQLE